MTYGLQVFNASGACTFDSDSAVGGVCLGFFTVAAAGSSWTFPDFAGAVGGVALLAGSGFGAFSYTVDIALGYPRFIFASSASGYDTVVLFVL